MAGDVSATQRISLIDPTITNESITKAIDIDAARTDYLNSQAKVAIDPPPHVILNTGAMPEDPLRGNIVNAQV